MVGVIFFCLFICIIVKYTFFSNSQIKMLKKCILLSGLCKMKNFSTFIQKHLVV